MSSTPSNVSDRLRVGSASSFEAKFGFCRALRVGNQVFVAGTAPISPDGTSDVDPDPAAQMRLCLEIVRAALAEVGASVSDVVRTRIFLVDADDAAAVGAVHGAVFGAQPPVATMVVVASLLDPRWRVEIEVDAVVR
ncbi:MAG: Rid family hydrolase [Acidimicrobiales bacterium]